MRKKFDYHLKVLITTLKQTIVFAPIAFGMLYAHGNSCMIRLSEPLEILYKNPSFLSTNLTEALLTKISLGAILCSVCWSWLTIAQVYVFISPGLIKYKSLQIFVTVVSFWLSSYLCVQFIMHAILPSFLHFLDAVRENPFSYLNNSEFQGSYRDYLEVILPLILATSCLLTCPFILFLLVYFKILNFSFIIKYRKRFYFTVAFVGTIFSSPDLFSLAIILTVLFNLIELYILFYYNAK